VLTLYQGEPRSAVYSEVSERKDLAYLARHTIVAGPIIFPIPEHDLELDPIAEEYAAQAREDEFKNNEGDPLDPGKARDHSLEILQTRPGGFDGVAFLDKAHETIVAVWSAVGSKHLASILPLLTPWCSRQWQHAPPHFVPNQPPSLTRDQLFLNQALPSDDVDLVEVGAWASEKAPPSGFPILWTFAQPRGATEGEATQWKLERVLTYEEL
jgi:hypothetical protein